MRELILDTETTGLSTAENHRITEIGIVETINQIPTNNNFHKYINPKREVDADAARITGLTTEFLADKPEFHEIADEFLEFIGNDPIVAHNASFDLGFMNYELELCGKPPLTNNIVDTLEIARKMFPGSRHSLDALCQRFEVDSSRRDLHGALLDAELLAEVYIELKGGRQVNFLGTPQPAGAVSASASAASQTTKNVRAPRDIGSPTEEELAAHTQFIDKIKDAIWYK